jgi:NAD(P)-dependent dehydrogenase (short-subunit alcohol dehydrogenase family)
MSAVEGPVLVTGGTGALGGAVVEELLDAGVSVVATWIVPEERDRLGEALGDRDGLRLVEGDLSTDEGAGHAAAAAIELGGPAALVHLVGGFAAGGRVHEAPDGEIERMVELNVMTTYRIARACLPSMIERGGGSIVCVGARAALEPFAGAPGYIASKAAVLALVRVLAIEYRDDGVRANAVLPSVIDTPANRRSMPDADHSTWVAPAEIARVIRFLCSGDSAPTSGAAIPVYGRA